MRPLIHKLRSRAARVLTRSAVVLAVGSLAVRAAGAALGRVPGRLRRGAATAAERSATSRRVLPSLYERHPGAARAPQRRVGLQSVPVDKIVGTMRHPSQNTADFLPLPMLRGENWRARWQRIQRANERLATLPPVDLVQVGDEYYVADGHNRVAAAREAGAVEVDADVVQLVLPGMTLSGQARVDAGSLIGGEEVRLAGAGRMSRTVEQRGPEDFVRRQDLLRESRTSPDAGEHQGRP